MHFFVLYMDAAHFPAAIAYVLAEVCFADLVAVRGKRTGAIDFFPQALQEKHLFGLNSDYLTSSLLPLPLSPVTPPLSIRAASLYPSKVSLTSVVRSKQSATCSFAVVYFWMPGCQAENVFQSF